ncbi:MAG: prephenate dehydratase domain-containing protein [Alphaproteobacteria bacterium]
MPAGTNMTMAALGGPNTFGGDAAKRICELYPEFTKIIYYPTAEEALSFEDGKADAACAPQQMQWTGVHPGIQAYVGAYGSKLNVLAEVIHAYHCSLLIKPGAKISDVKKVLGHTGSLTQCKKWFAANLPQAEIVVVDTSSQGAAEAVIQGDGSIASVGTPGMAKQYGLEQYASDIDGGAVGAYWAISPHPIFSEMPNRLVVTGRFRDDGTLSPLIGDLLKCGYTLQTTYQAPSGERLYEYDYVLRFAGVGALADIKRALEQYPAARLAGAFEMRESVG